MELKSVDLNNMTCMVMIHAKVEVQVDAASEGKPSNGMDRVVVWVKMDGRAVETNTQRQAVELRRRIH